MGQGYFRLDPAKAVSMEFKLPEEGGSDGQGLYRGADIVYETGERQLRGTHATAYRFPALQEKDGFKCSA
jgi:hypothetical protein